MTKFLLQVESGVLGLKIIYRNRMITNITSHAPVEQCQFANVLCNNGDS